MNAPITAAASVLLTASAGSREVFLVWRSPALRFMGGFVAFPGGKVHSGDDGLLDPAAGITPQFLCAVRELFEETGVLLARRADGTFPPHSDDLTRLRQQLLDEKITLANLLRLQSLRLDARDLTPAGHLVTPAFSPVRFDTEFFVAAMPPGQRAEVWEGELVLGAWATAGEAIDAWTRGEWLLSPPTVSILEAVRDRPIEDLPERLYPFLERIDAGHLPQIWFAPGVLLIPLDCRGLPPTTHTSAFLVGTGPRYLIDPGSTDPAEQEKLFAAIADAGASVDAIVLTHHHPDHIGAATVCAQRYGVPILAHPRTAELLRDTIRIDGFIHDGDCLTLGDRTLIAVHTPGHAPGHLAFVEPNLNLLFAGDMISTLSSVIICPDDGDLAEYLDSLRRLQQGTYRLLLPSHGPPTTKSAHVLSEAIAHRILREEQLVAALATGAPTIDDLTRAMYRGLPAASMPLARLQVETGLIKLHREGRALAEGERWRLK